MVDLCVYIYIYIYTSIYMYIIFKSTDDREIHI